ncbi:MAG TPA: hypothetical protein PKH54_01685 [Myxococcota bacterium]|nr:hypothetical protein [Myxococcota bacterium]HOA12987.1 hypothetical protein [Myxococcota bacterium]HOC98627.1 hypothetical protein [Myxococcota bacterium]HOH75892.1 hypothetical protein [Myxococcota bacterium]HPV03211.1 hypothetical protein [Myxococcota bacterium]
MKKSIFGRLLAVGVLAASLPLLVTCEVPNPRALFIYDAQAITPRSQCIIQPGQRAQAVLAFGILDSMLTNNYFLFPRFRNMMMKSTTISGEGIESGNVETNYLNISGAKVWIDLGQLGDELQATGRMTEEQLFILSTDGVQHTVAAGAEPEQEGTVGVEVIKTELGNLIGEVMRTHAGEEYGADINVYVMLMAENQAGEIIYSNELAFPIKVCFGCLVRPSADDTITDPPCFPGQDYGVPAVICPAIAEYPTFCPVY